MPTLNPLLERLEQLRIEKDVSKSELARQIGVSRHTVGRKLSGETDLTVGEAYQMCRVLGTTLQQVLDEIDTDASFR